MAKITQQGRRYPQGGEAAFVTNRLASLGTVPIVPAGSSATINGQVRGRRYGPMQMTGMGSRYLPSIGTVATATFNPWWAAGSSSVMDGNIPV